MKLAIRLLETWLPDAYRDAIIGDLAERRVEGLALWQETLAAIWHLGALEPSEDSAMSFVADLRHAARQLRRSPAFAVISVLTLALTIGATAAMFSIVDPLLLRALPYPDPSRLTMIWDHDPGGTRDNLGWETFADLVHDSKTIESAAAIGSWAPVLTDGSAPERLTGDRVSWTYFKTLGVHPAVGSDFTADEDAQNKNQVVMLSYGLWQRRFGGDPTIVGRKINLSGAPMTVAGVMPQSFENVVTPGAEIWRVLGYDASLPFACRTCHHLRMIARLRAGGERAAPAELNAIFARLATAYPKEYASTAMTIDGLQDILVQPVRPALVTLLGAVLLVLLIAAANVVNLQLARAARRETELAIRSALGAARAQIAQQLLAEGVLIAALSAGLGALIAMVLEPAVAAQLPPNTPRLATLHLEAGAVALVAGIAAVLAICIGLAPVVWAGRPAVFQSLRAGQRSFGAGHHRTRSGLVVGEFALALMLLAGSLLLARSFVKLMDVRRGFDATHLLTMQVDAVGPRYPDNETVRAFHERVLAAVRALPGVTSAAIANQIPLSGSFDAYGVDAQDKPLANPEQAPNGDRYVVTPEYMSAMSVPIVAGRGFTASDNRDSTAPVSIVSQALANRIWAGESPLGKRIRMGGDQQAWRTVVGVAGNVHHRGLDVGETMQFYVPERQWFFVDNQAMLVVRAAGDPATLEAPVRRVVTSLDPTQPIEREATMQRLISDSTSQRRLALLLFAAFAAMALILAAAGVYGVLASLVSERTREIGLRTALGAEPGEIMRLVLGEGFRLAGLGALIGIAAAAVLSRFIASLLFETAPADPLSLAAVVGVLSVVTWFACWLPARRAARVDPVIALRAD